MVEDVLDARESWSRELDEKQAVYAEACRLLLCVQDEAAPMMCMRNIETGKSWKFQCKCY